MDIKIDKHVPMPVVRADGSYVSDALRALHKANVGDSVLIATDGSDGARNTVAARANGLGGAGAFICRKVEGGVRVWKKSKSA